MATNVRSDNASLSEQLVMQETKTGAGTTIIHGNDIKVPRYSGGNWVKRQYVHHLPDNVENINIHYMYNTVTHKYRDLNLTRHRAGLWFEHGKYR